jgi:hypothetical protein
MSAGVQDFEDPPGPGDRPPGFAARADGEGVAGEAEGEERAVDGGERDRTVEAERFAKRPRRRQRVVEPEMIFLGGVYRLREDQREERACERPPRSLATGRGQYTRAFGLMYSTSSVSV